MYFLIDDDPDKRYGENEIDALLERCISAEYFEEDDDAFNEYLDQCYNNYEICGVEYSASQILREVDPDSYNQEKEYWASNEVDNEYENGRYELEHARIGGNIYICNYVISVYDDDDEDEDIEEDEDDIEEVETYVEAQTKQKSTSAQENEELENSFMNVFQTLM